MGDSQRTIRADLHNHSYYSPDSILSPVKMLEKARHQRLDVIAVTDHNTIRGGVAVRDLAAKRDPDIRVIVGEEVRTQKGEVLGLFLTEEVPRDLSPEETIDRIHAQGGLAGAPHPFDPFRGSLGDYLYRVYEQLDFIEGLNARMIREGHNDTAQEFAREHSIPTSAASDAHSPREIGRCFVEMADFGTPQEFIASLKAGRLVGRLSSPLIHLISRYSTIRRRLGWNPVQ
jgi:predicted metal-dependent phosphoesterase TrpH